MKSVVLAYEDQYCEELHRLIEALRRDAGQPGLILDREPFGEPGTSPKRCRSSCDCRSNKPGGRPIASCASPTVIVLETWPRPGSRRR